jgi:hypothetical protein
VNVLLWHVHGSWTTAFVQGHHTVLLPTTPGRGPDGRGRARTWTWPDSAVEVTPEACRHADVDVAVVQRPEELALVEAWTGRRPGRDLPLVYLEHNCPQGRIDAMRHPAADRDDCVLVHVTHHNALFWDAGRTPVRVIEHGIVDPGYRYTGEVERAVAVINEGARRWRVTGTDLLGPLSEAAPIDLYGMGAVEAAKRAGGRVDGHDDTPQDRLHDLMAVHRLYLHPVRWTSLGLSLLEAMALGMPVVALATTAVPDTVPAGAGVVSARPDDLRAAVRDLVADRDLARAAGADARVAVLRRHGLGRFLAAWDDLLKDVTS